MNPSNSLSIELSRKGYALSVAQPKWFEELLIRPISSLTTDELLKLREGLLQQNVQNFLPFELRILSEALSCISDQIINLRKMEQKDTQTGAQITASTFPSALYPAAGWASSEVKINPGDKVTVEGYPDNNPKTTFGAKKLPLDLVPPSAVHAMARGFADGARKYSPYNWREKTISSSVYYGAAMRHLMAWWDGEELAEDSGLSHLDHALCCIAMIVDGQSIGKLNDNRPLKGASGEMQRDWLKNHGT